MGKVMISGVAPQMTTPIAGTALSEFAEGSIVKIDENGSPVEFYVAKHDYESGLNGAGRTLVVRKDCYDTYAWHSSNVNAWASCTLRSWLNSTYKALLDSDIQSLMGTTTYYYTPGNGSWSVTTRSDAVFLLSATELGQSQSWFNTEGSALPIASTLKIAYKDDSTISQWTRSPYTGSTNYAVCMGSGGGVGYYICAGTYGSRPAFTLPANTKISDDGMVVA